MASVAVVVVVVLVVVVVVEIISTLVAVGRGGDYLDTGSDSSSSRVSREVSCSESVLWTTNCPLVLAYSGLGDGGHFQWSLYTFRIQSVFLLFIKYTHDYPHSTYLAPSSCDRNRPPQSQVACKLTPFAPPFTQPTPPLQIPRTPTAQRLTKTTSGIFRLLLSGTMISSRMYSKEASIIKNIRKPLLS